MKRTLVIVYLLFSFAMSYGQVSTDSSAVEDGDYSEDYSETDEQPDENSEDSEYEAPPPTVIDPEDMVTTAEYKREHIPVRDFDREKWKDIVGKTNYDERPPVRRKKKDRDNEKSDADDESSFSWAGGQFFSILGYTLIGGILVLLLYLVIKNTKLDKKVKKTDLTQDPEQPVENIEELDIHALLEKALNEGHFRIALRLYYLGLLKRLNEVGAIAWKKDKTNRDYLSELFAKEYFYDDVRKLTVAYEYVWYGLHTPSNESFQKLFSNFETLNEKLNNAKSS